MKVALTSAVPVAHSALRDHALRRIAYAQLATSLRTKTAYDMTRHHESAWPGQNRRGLTLAAVGALAILTAACGDRLSADSAPAQARQAAQQGNLDLSASILRRELEQHPESADARVQLASVLLEQGEYENASIELGKARKAGARDDDVIPLLARALVERKKYQVALDEYSSIALKKEAAQAELKTLMAIAQLRLGGPEKALQMVDEVLASSPGQARAAALAARLHANAGRLDKAFAVLDAAAKSIKDGESAEIWLARADLLLYGKRDIDGAKSAYQKAVEAQPRTASAHASLVQLHLLKKDISKADAALKAMIVALPKHPMSVFTASILALHKKDYQRARELLQPLLKVASANADVLALSGSIELELGNTANAITQLQRAIFISPQTAQPRKTLARAWVREGAPDKALEVLAPLIQSNTQDTELFVIAGGAHLAANRPSQAETFYSKALAKTPDDTNVKTQIAMIKMRSDPSQALSLLQDTAANSADTIADMALIAAQLQKRDFDGAKKSIDLLQSKDTKSAQPAMLLGQLAMMKRDFKGARSSFEQALGIDGTNAAAALALSSLDQLEGSSEKAEVRLNEFIGKNPRAISARLAVASSQERRGASHGVILKTYSEAIAANPSDSSARLAYMGYLLKRNDSKGLLDAAQSAAAAIPEDLSVLSMLGTAQLLTGDVNQAVATGQKLVNKAPSSSKAYAQLAQAEVIAGQSVRAEKSFKRALELDPTNMQASRGLIALGLNNKRPELSLDAAKAIQRDRPNDGLGHLLAGDILLRLRRQAEALETYRAGLSRKYPLNLPSRVYLLTKELKGDVPASKFSGEWLQKNPQDIGFKFFVGNIELEASRLPNAEKLFSEIVEAYPKHVAALNNLAWIRVREGKQGAVALAERALTEAPDFAAVLDTLALALAAEGQIDKAIKNAQLAVSKAPDVPSYYVTLARLQLKSGDKVAGKASLVEAEKRRPAPALVEEINELKRLAAS
ncbi:XrtA/PEP-CTERM system TPR-repeat protein PrsT [Ideonella sp. DXS22W]|uniref:XrtA/PEP-CTERM system TPR-repeat protein PrsT n=1 Tax=Pseudaquabacterium inlustre TaxID=2984192 RepID=A0ABU9CNB3_9BURK